MQNLKGVVKKLPIKYYGKNTVLMAYKPPKRVTIEEITDFVQKKSNALKNKGFKGQISVAVKWDHGWRSGYFEEVGDPVELYELGDSDFGQVPQADFSEFQIIVIPE